MVVLTKLQRGMMTMKNINTSIIKDRTTLILVNQWKNRLDEATILGEKGDEEVAGMRMNILRVIRAN
jgi:hypothetical protein